MIGHTGSGKSTLIQHLNGLLQPSEGSKSCSRKSIWDAKGKCDARDAISASAWYFSIRNTSCSRRRLRSDIAYGPTNMSLPQDEIDARVRSQWRR